MLNIVIIADLACDLADILHSVLLQEVISRKVLLDEGFRQVAEVEQAAIWRFLWWSGTITVHVIVDQNRKDHTVRKERPLVINSTLFE